MRWLYYSPSSWPPQGTPARQIYLRAVDPATDGTDDVRVSNIVRLDLFATDYYFMEATENPLDSDEVRRIYMEELSQKDYFIDDKEVSESEEYMMAKSILYLKCTRFSKEEMLDWVKVYFGVNGFPCDTLEEQDLTYFSELNPLLHLFSLENVQKFEDQLGKEWWKKDTEQSKIDPAED
jgi:hypothetical protein